MWCRSGGNLNLSFEFDIDIIAQYEKTNSNDFSPINWFLIEYLKRNELFYHTNQPGILLISQNNRYTCYI